MKRAGVTCPFPVNNGEREFFQSSLFFMLSRFTLLSERNSGFTRYINFAFICHLYYVGRKLRLYLRRVDANLFNINSRTVWNGNRTNCPGAVSIFRGNRCFRCPGPLSFPHPAAFRARKLPSHVGGATNHVRRTGRSEGGPLESLVRKFREGCPRGGELRRVNSLHAATTSRKWRRPRCFDVYK